MKRLIDVSVSLVAILFLMPVFLILYVAIKINLGGPVIFSQLRPGKGGRIFRMYKFRSMTDLRDEQGILLSNEKRMTKFGRKLRSTSLDELPGLFNVLIGDMSLVGPRPLLVDYLPLYNDEQSRRHDMRPGITGWAQVNGRNSISWDEKFKLDVWYIDNQSFCLDMKILAMTIKKVFIREGINSSDEVTMKKFTGNN